MNILFLTIGTFDNFEVGSVHIDIVKALARKGHNMYVACTNTNQNVENVSIEQQKGVHLLRIKTGAVKKNTNLVKKGIATIMLEQTFIKAIKKHLDVVKFDLVLYHTPPVTFEKVVRFIKERDGAASYLLLKDIFPQNAVDLGMMSKHGLKGFVYRYFRKKEIRLYAASDYIGCMSPANVKYLLDHNPFLSPQRLEVAPNSIEPNDNFKFKSNIEAAKKQTEKTFIRRKYGLPLDKPIFIYGGNLGKPQGIDYLISCLDQVKDRHDCLFLVVGDGSEYPKIQKWYEGQDCNAVRVLRSLPKDDYDVLARSCDVGLIFLDHRFTIPNYPSRLLSYLVAKMPVLCSTDPNTDVGRIAEENGYGYWCESVKPESFTALVDKILNSDMRAMGNRGYEFLCKNYLAEHTCNAILKHFENEL